MTFAELTDFASQNPMLSGLFVLLTLAIVVNEVLRLTRGFGGITPVQLTQLLNSGNATVVDLSPAVDFAKGHIEGSKNVPMSQFDAGSKVFAGDKARPVVVVCRRGMDSLNAAKALKKAGFTQVSVLEGGVDAWSSSGNLLVGKRGKS